MLTARVRGEGSEQDPLAICPNACPCCDARPGVGQWERLARVGESRMRGTGVYAAWAELARAGA